MGIINRFTKIAKTHFTPDQNEDPEDVFIEQAREDLANDGLAIDNETYESDSIGEKVKTGLKYISGVYAIEERNKSIANEKRADAIIQYEQAETQKKKDRLQSRLDEFGRKRLKALRNTVGVFLNFLDRINNRYAVNEYLLQNLTLSIPHEQLIEMRQIDMKASEALMTAVKGGVFSSVALAGTPALVTSAVTAFGSASTGTAISTLSGAAAHNAVLAWLGGGSLASGGGGMALGATVLTGITCAVSFAVGAIAGGSMASSYYSKKHTESEERLNEVREWSAELRWARDQMDEVEKRVNELENITKKIYQYTVDSLNQLEALTYTFDPRDPMQAQVFQKTILLVKSMSTVSQTPILDSPEVFNNKLFAIKTETERVLNTTL